MYNLQRFLDAQQGDYEQALAEVSNGRKYSHWMKVLSCMTLFAEVASDDLFQQVIIRYYQGKPDETTRKLLENN